MPGGVFDPARDQVITGNYTFQGTVTNTGAAGYGPANVGVGSAVTQLTNRTTGVTINALCGTITTNTASLAAEASAEFTVTNNQVLIGDVVVVAQRSGSNSAGTVVYVSTVANGSFKIVVQDNNASGGTAETGAIIINFAVIRGVAS